MNDTSIKEEKRIREVHLTMLALVEPLVATIEKAQQYSLPKSHDAAINFAKLFVKSCDSIRALLIIDKISDALTIHRLQLEHFFNFISLIKNKNHIDLLEAHLVSEPIRQFKIFEKLKSELSSKKKYNYNPIFIEKFEKAKEIVDSIETNENPIKLSWKKISETTYQTKVLYLWYQSISFINAHSTLAHLRPEFTKLSKLENIYIHLGLLVNEFTLNIERIIDESKKKNPY